MKQPLEILKIVALSTTLILVTATAQAAALTAVSSGWYNETGTAGPTNNFVTGFSLDLDLRSYFVFDISSLSGVVTKATFSVPESTKTNCPSGPVRPTGCYASPDASEIVKFYDVTTDIGDLTNRERVLPVLTISAAAALTVPSWCRRLQTVGCLLCQSC